MIVWLPLMRPPTGDLASNPGPCPDWGPSGPQARTQCTEPHVVWPQSMACLLNHFHEPSLKAFKRQFSLNTKTNFYFLTKGLNIFFFQFQQMHSYFSQKGWACPQGSWARALWFWVKGRKGNGWRLCWGGSKNFQVWSINLGQLTFTRGDLASFEVQ